MHITVFDGYRRAHILSCSAAALPAPAASASIGLSDPWQAARFLQRYFCDAHGVTRLRAALAVDLDACMGQDDDEIIRLAAARIASGAWSVRYDPVAPGAVPVVSRVGKAPDGPARAGRAAAVANRAAVAVAAAPSTPAAATVTREWPEAADQVAQAVTLEQAAVSGTPFCAICAERARARAAAAANADSPA